MPGRRGTRIDEEEAAERDPCRCSAGPARHVTRRGNQQKRRRLCCATVLVVRAARLTALARKAPPGPARPVQPDRPVLACMEWTEAERVNGYPSVGSCRARSPSPWTGKPFLPPLRASTTGRRTSTSGTTDDDSYNRYYNILFLC